MHLQIEKIKKQSKRTIVFIVEDCLDKGLYPYERTVVLAQLLKEENVHIFVRSSSQTGLAIFSEANLSPIIFEKYEQLCKHLKQLDPDLLVRDGKDSEREQVEILKPFCKTIVHFDDFGAGNTLADCVLLSLYPELKDTLSSKTIGGSFAFVVPSNWPRPAEEVLKSLNDPPHIVVAFEDGDPNNLTYRTLRHLTQLHIPLQITLVIDDEYSHATDDLQMMVLSRRNTAILRKKDALKSLLPTADIIICNANYTPYKIASYGISCITLAQNEHELLHAFPREHNGFIHLGLGRKMKQSHIQNAVMELLLHEARRERTIKKQRQLALYDNNETLQTLLLDFAYERHNIASI